MQCSSSLYRIANNPPYHREWENESSLLGLWPWGGMPLQVLFCDISFYPGCLRGRPPGPVQHILDLCGISGFKLSRQREELERALGQHRRFRNQSQTKLLEPFWSVWVGGVAIGQMEAVQKSACCHLGSCTISTLLVGRSRTRLLQPS